MKVCVTNRTERVTLRFTCEEQEKLYNLFAKADQPTFTDFLRKLIFRQRMNVSCRDESLEDFLQEMVWFKKELQTIALSFNQQIEKINGVPQLFRWFTRLVMVASLHKTFVAKLAEIQDTINRFPEKRRGENSQLCNFWEQ